MAGEMQLTTTFSSNTTQPIDLSCRLFNGDDHKCDVVIAVKRVTASLSIIGCTFMIAVIWLFRKYTEFSQRLILYLSICAFFDSIAYVAGDYHISGMLCDFQGAFLNFFDYTMLLWVCCITFNLYMNAIKMTRTDRFEWAYHLFCFGISGAVSALPFIDNKYGPAGAWCWIDDDWKWRFGIWYCPLFVIIGILFFAYLYIIYSINKKVKTWEGMYDPDVERNKQMMKEDVKPLTAYPFVYLLLSIFPLINRIQNAVSPDPVYALVILHAMTSPLQGAVNAVVFGLDKETRSRLTPSQIKILVQNRIYRIRHPGLVHEYPVKFSTDSTPTETHTTSSIDLGIQKRNTTSDI